MVKAVIYQNFVQQYFSITNLQTRKIIFILVCKLSCAGVWSSKYLHVVSFSDVCNCAKFRNSNFHVSTDIKRFVFFDLILFWLVKYTIILKTLDSMFILFPFEKAFHTCMGLAPNEKVTRDWFLRQFRHSALTWERYVFSSLQLLLSSDLRIIIIRSELSLPVFFPCIWFPLFVLQKKILVDFVTTGVLSKLMYDKLMNLTVEMCLIEGSMFSKGQQLQKSKSRLIHLIWRENFHTE